MQEIFNRYQVEVSPDPVDLKVVGAWAIANRLWHPRPIDIQSRFARDMADCLREEYRTDARGRRYRAKHAAPAQRGGKTDSLWADLDDPSVPHEHFVKSFARRRQQIVGDCFQLKTDADVYNDQRRPEAPIQVVLNFKNDVEEMEYAYVDETEAN